MKDEIVQAKILKMVTSQLAGTIEYLDTAKQIWDKLYRSLGAEGSISHTMDIFSILLSCTACCLHGILHTLH